MNSRWKTYASSIALFGSLGVASAESAALVVVVGCDTSSDPGRNSYVTSSVTTGSPNSYDYTICNSSRSEPNGGTHLLRNWELPYDPAGDITKIRTPGGWAYTIETIGTANPDTGWTDAEPTWFASSDPFYDPRYLGLTQVLHFFTCDGLGEQYGNCYDKFKANSLALRPGDRQDGFGFDSPFAETNAPYQASWVTLPPRSGDPAFPGPGAPNTPGLLNVPEPGGLSLVAAGIAALLGARGARRKSETT